MFSSFINLRKLICYPLQQTNWPIDRSAVQYSKRYCVTGLGSVAVDVEVPDTDSEVHQEGHTAQVALRSWRSDFVILQHKKSNQMGKKENTDICIYSS